MKITVKCVRIDEPHFSSDMGQLIATWRWCVHIDAKRYETGLLRGPVGLHRDDVMKAARRAAKAMLHKIQAKDEVAKLVGTVLEGEL